jgi:hypothetical protein
MNLEKSLFLLLTLVGVFHQPLALIPAGMVFIYILSVEHSIHKKNYESLLKHIDEKVLKLDESINETDNNLQKVKDSIIALKMERGIASMNKMARNG